MDSGSGASLEKYTPEEDLALEKLSVEDKQRVNEIAGTIDIFDTQALVQFGLAAQNNISTFADTILTQVKSKDTGHAGESLTNLMVTVKDLKVDSLSDNFLANIPLLYLGYFFAHRISIKSSVVMAGWTIAAFLIMIVILPGFSESHREDLVS